MTAQQLLQIAQSNGSRLQELINDLLDMEKMMAGKCATTTQEQTLWPLLEDAMAHNQPSADRYQVAPELAGSPVEVDVAVDSQRLVPNAAKFSSLGSVVTLAASNNDWLRIGVEDRGVAIKEEFKRRIFARFSQADAGDARQKGGAWLGLVICKALVEAMLGRIGFGSQDQLGSTFWFEFPIASLGVRV